VEVGDGEPCAGVEVGKTGQLGQVLAAAARPRPAYQPRLRQLLNNSRRILRIQSWNDFTLIPLQYYGYGTGVLVWFAVAVLWIRTSFNADPTSFNADPDPRFRVNAPGPLIKRGSDNF
jgi:hypothetical protein